MTDPVALLSEYVRIDTSNPPGDCRKAAELLCGTLRESGLSPVAFGAKPEKPNVIPGSAEGTIDARIVPGEDPEAVADRVRALVADLDVMVEILFAEKPNGSQMGPLCGAMEAAVLSVHSDAAVVPYMSTGFTDSRFFRSIGIPTYGLMPVLLPRAEHGKIHGVDERIPLGRDR